MCWIIGIVGGTLGVGMAFPALYETQADRQVVAQTMGTPAGLAFTDTCAITHSVRSSPTR
ncbi:hypothetical protein [Brevibacterium otitidis]|uniref:Uncharacterized protein n=1 Tax=Brevibacterium otitidis TaxID=53364 RepID=A0ABV5WZK6_9MICO